MDVNTAVNWKCFLLQLGVAIDPSAALELQYGEQGLCLIDREQPEIGKLHINFLDPRYLYRLRHPLRYREPFVRAIGLKARVPLRVLDVTAGVGKEAFFLASLGAQVYLFERHPLLGALLTDALLRVYSSKLPWSKGVLSRIAFRIADALKCFPTGLRKGDVIYFDPMFPKHPKAKAAAVKQSMAWIKRLNPSGDELGTEIEEEFGVLYRQIRHFGGRLVVKRPYWANPLGGVAPSMQWTMKKYRFDVYLP